MGLPPLGSHHSDGWDVPSPHPLVALGGVHEGHGTSDQRGRLYLTSFDQIAEGEERRGGVSYQNDAPVWLVRQLITPAEALITPFNSAKSSPLTRNIVPLL